MNTPSTFSVGPTHVRRGFWVILPRPPAIACATRLLAGCLVAAACVARGSSGSAAFAQNAGAKYSTWSKVEAAPETRAYKENLREGGGLDATLRALLELTALPQLALASNRSTIERTRRRMRELLLTEIADEKAFEDASQVFLDFFGKLARDEDADLLVRINALLLVGELKAKDGKPWPPTAGPLASAARDAKLPIAIRVAATAGLARHAEAARATGDDASKALAADALPAIVAILREPVEKDTSVELDWLVSRSLSMLPSLGRWAPKEVAATLPQLLAKLLEDPLRSVDVRVRAAAALGAMVVPTSGVNGPQTIAAIRSLALSGLEGDDAIAASRRLEQEYIVLLGAPDATVAQPAGPPGLGQPGTPNTLAIAEQVGRRAAWRLVTLADAIAPLDGKGGLAVLSTNTGTQATDLAKILRDFGMNLDKIPDEQSLNDAVAAIHAPATGTPGPQAPQRQPKPEEPAAEEPATDPAASPFDSP